MSQRSLEEFGAYRKARELFDLLVTDMQSVRRAERHPHSEEHRFVIPHLGEEIVALMQTHPMKRSD